MIKSGLCTTVGNPIPLRGVEVTGEVLGAHALVRVRQRYQNIELRPVEAIYTFPLPADAALVGFSMTCGGRRIEGTVKEREDAFRAYDDAILEGHGAALLEQERANVFTASVGNILPGEETLVEVKYVQRLQADEGALRWMIPTLVAPRYIPGTPQGDRTAHGAAAPTDVVPDADRISPHIGQVDYGLKLDLVFDLGGEIEVESPSHAIRVKKEDGHKVRVAFTSKDVALDRDVVISARGLAQGPTTSVGVHRAEDGEPAVLALTVVPDLAGALAKAAKQEVVFLIDVSGSMEGASITEAKAALRLCLRHLGEGDRFNIIAFQSSFDAFSPEPVPFTQKTLEKADRWAAALVANGGTELLQPLLHTMRQAPGGVVVLLTDGQVGNEDQILRDVLAARGKQRIYSFGIGTNVSDNLLRELAKRTNGAVEFIHPGERIDEKVVATFARAVAPRVEDVKLTFDGIEVSELAPSEPGALVDGEPWSVFGRAKGIGSGRAELRGKLGGEAFFLSVPIDLSDAPARPLLTKLWASERIRDLELKEVTGRRAEHMKQRIVELAVKHGLASRHTSFVVVEERTGDRKASGMPETRAVPVNLPAGWEMFKQRRKHEDRFAGSTRAGAIMPGAMPMAGMAPPPMGAPPAFSAAPAPKAAAPGLAKRAMGAVRSMLGSGGGMGAKKDEDSKVIVADMPHEGKPSVDPIVALLGEQLASGLWPGAKDTDADRLAATARALTELVHAGVTSAHALHGAPVKKAIAAVLPLAEKLATPAAEKALAAAWLAASGKRTRGEVEAVIRRVTAFAALAALLGDEAAVRAHLDRL